MKRRDFLRLLPLLPSTAWASDGLLIDDPGDHVCGGMLIDEPKPIVSSDKPVVFAYSTVGCGPCNAAKKAISESPDLPFVVEWKRETPSFVESFPTFHWQAMDGSWRSLTGWNGLSHLSATVSASMASRIRKPTVAAPLDMTRRGGDWTWPGNLARHLCDAHGYCGNAIPATGRGQIDLHNRLHNGGAASRSRGGGSFLFWSW